MATLSRLTYEFPPIDCVPGPCSSIPTEFSELGFDRISYYNYFHNGLIDGWAFIVEGKDLAACFDHMTNSGPRLEWVVEKPGFRFDYDEQRIVPGHPHATACDNVVADAIDVADELGIQVGGLNLFVERDWREFNTRPSRSWAAQFYLNDK
jgi:hypothetical protein